MSTTKRDPRTVDAAEQLSTGYPDVPSSEPGLIGGPATESVPGSHQELDVALNVTNDGGETTMSGRPRETGGERAAIDVSRSGESHDDSAK